MRELPKLSKTEEERAVGLHEKSIVIDCHCGEVVGGIYTDEMGRKMKEMFAANKPIPEIRGTIGAMRSEALLNDPKTREEYARLWNKSGVTCIGKAVAIGNPGLFTQPTLGMISNWIAKLDDWSDLLVKAVRAEDIRRAKKDGKHAVFWDSEDAFPLGHELDMVDVFYKFGIRMITLTYNLRNLVGDGCTSRCKSGLSYFGVDVVNRMNELGMIVDVGHSCDKTAQDAIEISKDPVALSHSGCSAVYQHDRLRSDETIQALGEKDGVIGIMWYPGFMAKRDETDINTVLDHIDHVVEVAGINHVGVGSDYGERGPDKYRDMQSKMKLWRAKEKYKNMFRSETGEWDPHGFRPEHELNTGERPAGLENWSDWPNLTKGLVARGYSDQETQKIIGGNWLRLFEKVVG